MTAQTCSERVDKHCRERAAAQTLRTE